MKGVLAHFARFVATALVLGLVPVLAPGFSSSPALAQEPDTPGAGIAGLVVGGLGGNADYQRDFDEHSARVLEAMRSLQPAVPSNSSSGPSSGERIVGLSGPQATREAVLKTLDALVQTRPERLYLVLIGHGNDDAAGYRFNLPGPDLSEADLVQMLAAASSLDQVLIAATSASGALLDSMVEPGRQVLTATRSGREINAVRFAGFFADALHGGRADLDRNEILTVNEAFRYALEQTEQSYKDEQLIISEHAQLQGESAERTPLAYVGALRDSMGDPKVSALLDERLALEVSFEALLARKNSLATAEYYDELEALLLEMAKLQIRIDQATGWVGGDG